MSVEDRKDFSALLHVEVLLLGKLLIKENLHYAGIASGLGEDLGIP